MTLIESFAQGLGAFVWWSLRAVDVDRAAMRSAFEAVSLGAAVPRDPRPGALLSRACREALIGRHGTRFDRVRDDGTVVVSVLSRCAKDPDAETVEWKQCGIVRADIASGQTSWTATPGDVDADAILTATAANYAHARRYASSDDLRTAITHALNGRRRDLLLGAVTVNGVHYVRREQLDRLRALATWIGSVSAGDVTIVTVEGSDANRAQVASGAQATILGRVRELQGEADHIAELVRNASDEDLDGVLKPYLDRFELVRSSVGLYSDVLGEVRDELLRAEREAREAIMKRCVPAA